MKVADQKILEEAEKIVEYLDDFMEELTLRQREFVEDMADQLLREQRISERQLQYLRDLYDRA